MEQLHANIRCQVYWIWKFLCLFFSLAWITQPQDRTVETCNDAAFSVTTAGSLPFTYTWYRDGNIIGGANEPEFNLAAVVPSDAGEYSVMVSNSTGDTTSNTATSTVNGVDDTCLAPIFPWNLFMPAILANFQ